MNDLHYQLRMHPVRTPGRPAAFVMQLGDRSVMAGTRFHVYDGLSHGTSIQPRIGMTYRFDRTNALLAISYHPDQMR